MYLLSAFTLGLFGSLHCVGMCGSLMLTANGGQTDWRSPLAYQAGRLLTYAFLGVLLGSLGLGLRLWNAQSVMAILSGGLLLLLAYLKLDPGDALQKIPAYARFQFWLRSTMGRFIKQQGAVAQFGIGCCNGLLPCGLVYLAVIAAANMGDPLTGATFMLAFGAGTLPLLITTLYAGRRLLTFRSINLNKWTPAIMALTGILLIWRGWNAHMPVAFSNFQDMVFPPMCH
ncbi:sulfite exporter TauE/SafE family protein [Neolewinella agarilytica]|uniref:Urease accessory protein UreH-like transmembrane domain-containing protein n=1 Tax=Neolewinella agarilytica TaxID=478744 RepID=A0A1H9ENM6_9BACT|nr:sulfite exporter TauE/SafE family protein [Neolewinella agarilytica]SEQ27249.1 hypothetical protein SAMN05444359_107143 [Neolewinella agarilytica]